MRVYIENQEYTAPRYNSIQVLKPCSTEIYIHQYKYITTSIYI